MRPDLLVVALLLSYTLFGAWQLPLSESRPVLPYHVVLPASLFLVVCFALSPRPSTYSVMPAPLRRLSVVILPFLLLLVASTVATGWTAEGVELLRNYVASFVLVLVVASSVRNEAQLRRVVVALLWVTAAGGALGLLQTFVDPRIAPSYWFGGLAAFENGHPSPLGYATMEFKYGNDMLVGILPALALFLRRGQIGATFGERAAVGAALVLGLVGLALSLGASSLLATAVATGWMLLRSGARLRVAIAIAALPVLAACAWNVREVADWVLRHQTSVTSMEGRADLLVAGLSMLQTAPVFGIGLGNFVVHSPDYLLQITRRVVITAPHNVFLGVLVETGIVGLVLYLRIWLESARITKPGALGGGWVGAASLGLRGAFLAYAIDSLFHNYFFDNHFWLLLGLAASAASIAAAAPAPALESAEEPELEAEPAAVFPPARLAS